MNFAPKELCKKLVGMGCESVSEYSWVCYGFSTDGWPDLSKSKPKYELFHNSKSVNNDFKTQAFSLECFVANTEAADLNVLMVEPRIAQLGEEIRKECIQIFKHRMIDAEDPWKFLEETMK